MINILVTGAKGQLACELNVLSSVYPYNFFFKDKKELNICSYENLSSFLQKHNITTIINSAAYTAVDKAESDSEIANDVNHLAVKNLAELSKKFKIKLIHISTDYVFDGKHYIPYKESDLTNPNSIYGKTKRDGENAMIDINPKNSIIIRTSWLYSGFGTNFVKTILKLGKERDSLGIVFDQIGTPTYAKDLAGAILDILPQIQNEKVTIYNYSNEGVASWYDFAKEIMDMAKLECQIEPIETKEYPTPALRPHYSLLNKAKIKESFNLGIPYWKDSLSAYFNTMLESNMQDTN